MIELRKDSNAHGTGPLFSASPRRFVRENGPPFQTNAMGSQGWFAPGPRLRAFELRGETEQRAVATHAGNELHAYR